MGTDTRAYAFHSTSHHSNFAGDTAAKSTEEELLRSGYDIDGARVELIYDLDRQRFSIATRYTYLAHIAISFSTPKWHRIGVVRATAVFEAVCRLGASKIVALLAKKHAMALDPAQFSPAAGFEREVIRRTRNAMPQETH